MCELESLSNRKLIFFFSQNFPTILFQGDKSFFSFHSWKKASVCVGWLAFSIPIDPRSFSKLAQRIKSPGKMLLNSEPENTQQHPSVNATLAPKPQQFLCHLFFSAIHC